MSLTILAACSDSDQPSVENLKSQLAGEHCRFSHDYGNPCSLRNEGFWQWMLREPHHCDMAAVECLMEIRTPAAYDALIGILTTKSDVETCDGRYAIRTYAVEALGESGYEPAIEPLKKHLASNPVETLSSGASGCSADPEPIEAIKEALRKLTGS